MKVWRYVLTDDTGTAPNYDPPCLTLALCKPKIRQGAQPGNLVIAFAGRALGAHPDAIIWAGVVTESIGFADYWRDARFQSKKGNPPKVLDNIYEPHPGEPDGFKQHPHAYHDKYSKEKDVGGRNALIFGGPDVWVFRNAPRILPARFGLSMGSARRGHQTSYIGDREWNELRAWLSSPSVSAQPFIAPEMPRTASRPQEPAQRTRRC
jgi:hypothetical protein